MLTLHVLPSSLPAFEPLYISMSDSQKLIADATFAAKMNKHGHIRPQTYS